MNRYKTGGPSKATATTLCQKCLKRGHYSYECTAPQQERPYQSRPSRTQQLLNPKLAPKLTIDTPKEIALQKGTADRILARKAAERGRKRSLDDLSDAGRDLKRTRSASSYSSDTDSVSTISTNRSRSRQRSSSEDQHYTSQRADASPPVARRTSERKMRHISRSRSRSKTARLQRRSRSDSAKPDIDRRNRRRSRSLAQRGRLRGRSLTPSDRSSSRSEDYGRRRTFSRSGDFPHRHRDARKRDVSSRSRSPWRGSRTNDLRYQHNSHDENDRHSPKVPAPRPRSLSPYSKRLGLTQAKGSGS